MIKVIDYGKRSTMWFGDLNVGDTFLWNEQLYIKCHDTAALNLDCGGEYELIEVDEQVIPVDIDIKVVR